MFTNRISTYVSTREPVASNSRDLRRKVQPQTVPPGFVALPEPFQSQPATLYQIAYQAARSAANERLLQLLRSRARFN